MMRYRRGMLRCAASAFGCVLLIGLLAVWNGRHAQQAATAMKSSPWINNDRCIQTLAGRPAPDSHFRFAVLGDVQVGTAYLPHLMAALHEHTPLAFAVQTGDFVSHPRPGQYMLSLSALSGSGLAVPMLVIPGNHDVRESAPKVERVPENMFHEYFGSSQFYFTYGGALFVGLDNSQGPLRPEQYDWLESTLDREHAVGQPVLLFIHAQPIHWSADEKVSLEAYYQRFFAIVQRHHVNYVFSGNWHGQYREERNGTTYVINGRGGDFDSAERLVPATFTIVEVDGTRVTDSQFAIPSRVSLVVASLLQDWLVAKLGYLTVQRPRLTLGILIVSALGVVLCLWSLWKTTRRDVPHLPPPVALKPVSPV